MKIKMCVTAVLGLVVIAYGALRGVSGGKSGKAEIQAVVNQFEKALEKEDMALLSKLFAHDEDIVMYRSDLDARFVGWKAIKANLQEWFEETDDYRLTFRDIKIKLHSSGTSASVSFLHDGEFLLHGEQSQFKGLRVTWSMEKRGGVWVLVQSHWSWSFESIRKLLVQSMK